MSLAKKPAWEYLPCVLGAACAVGFTHAKKYMISTAMCRMQTVRLQKYLKAGHPETFMMI